MRKPWSWWLMLGAAAVAAAVLVMAVIIWAAPEALQAQTCREPVPLRFETASKITRSELGFTQGLEVRDGQVFVDLDTPAPTAAA